MKGLKRTVLACTVAVAPLASQGSVEPLSNSEMSGVTGQAGITIEVSTAVTIEQVEYSQGNSGSLLINDIGIGGFVDGPDSTVDVRVLIDLNDNGDARIRVRPMEIAPIDARIAMGSLGLQGDAASATLISNLDMRTWVTSVDILARVEDLDGSTSDSGSMDVAIDFAIENLDVDFDVAAISLEGFRMGGVGSLSTLQDEPYFPNTDSESLAAEGAQLELTLGATSPLSGKDFDALRIDINAFAADIWMPTIKVGGGSIGSVAISNLTIDNTRLAIYSRD